MNIQDLWALVNTISMLDDEGIDRNSSLEEVNDAIREQCMADDDDETNHYSSIEEFHNEWDLAEKMCMMYDKLLSGEGI